MPRRLVRTRVVLGALLLLLAVQAIQAEGPAGTYNDLLALFEQFRAFERPPMPNAVPDYRVRTLAAKRTRLKAFQSRLASIDPARWPVEQQVDHALVGAVMNGFEFELRVLQPWARDPAFYKSLWTAQSDTPLSNCGRTRGRCPLRTKRHSPRSCDPATADPGTRQSHRQCARSLDHRHGNDGAAGHGS